jgi:hypothetical protein
MNEFPRYERQQWILIEHFYANLCSCSTENLDSSDAT